MVCGTWTVPAVRACAQRPGWTRRGRRAEALLAARDRGGPGLGGAAFFLPGAGEDAGQRVVALVAGVFEDLALQGVELVLAAPGLVPDGGVGDGELVAQAVGGHARETLSNRQIPPGAVVGLGLRDVVGLDDQGIALPPADAVAEVRADLVGAVGAVQPDV